MSLGMWIFLVWLSSIILTVIIFSLWEWYTGRFDEVEKRWMPKKEDLENDAYFSQETKSI